jgi:crotonobetaine/carnitine-CoA ligase
MPATVFVAFMESAAASPGRAFLCVPPALDRAYHPAGIELSYAEVRTRVLELRDRYAEAGYGHGHRVALLLENRPEFFDHYLALNALGCSIVPINPDYRHDEMLYQMEHSEADLAVVIGARVADLAEVARARAKPLPVVIAEDLRAQLPKPGVPARAGAPGLDTECSLLYTSGTTGRPKGCITCAILTANCLVMPARFSPTRWWPDIITTGATIIHYLGVVPPLLLNQPPSPDDRRHRVRFGLGAGVEPQLHPAFEERFGCPLIEVWGMTETGRILADAHEPRHITTRAFGRPFGGFEANVVDDADREVAPETEGELVVRWGGPEGPRHGFFSGYLKNDAATAEAWRGGWFHTGDAVRRTVDGMLVFVDRKKNIIRRAGENIAAAEVEAVLQAHDAVAQVAVLAVPDEIREEEVMACIVPMPGVSADGALAEGLMAWALAKLAYFKAPGFILFVDRLPTTGTQKVQKTRIFPRGEDPRGRPGVIDLRALKKRG